MLNSNQNSKSIIINLGVGSIQVLHGIAGKLAIHVRNWAKITKGWVLDTIKDYQVNFVIKPCQSKHPHTPYYSAEQNCLIEQDIRHFLKKGVVFRLHEGQSREGFYSETCNQFEGSKRACLPRTLQDGGNPHLEGLSEMEVDNSIQCAMHTLLQRVQNLHSK